MNDAEADVLAYTALPAQHQAPQHEPTGAIEQGSEAPCLFVGIFPNEYSIVRPIEAVLLEANDEWQLLSRYMQVEAMAELNRSTVEEETTLQITPRAA